MNHDSLCVLQSLKAFQPITDNVKVTIRSLDCKDDTARRKVKRVYEELFLANCVNHDDDIVNSTQPPDKIVDERPVIHVNQNHIHFNITKEAVFENLIFDGINQFSIIKRKDGEASKISSK